MGASAAITWAVKAGINFGKFDISLTENYLLQYLFSGMKRGRGLYMYIYTISRDEVAILCVAAKPHIEALPNDRSIRGTTRTAYTCQHETIAAH